MVRRASRTAASVCRRRPSFRSTRCSPRSRDVKAALTSEVYYRTVDPNNSRTSLERLVEAGGLHRRRRYAVARGHRGHGPVRARRVRQQLRSRLRPADVHAHGRARQRLLVRQELQHVGRGDPPARLVRDRGDGVQPARRGTRTRRRSSSSSSPTSKTAAATRRASRASTSTVAASASRPATASRATAAHGRPASRSSSSTRPAAIATDAACYAWPAQQSRRRRRGRRRSRRRRFLPWDIGSLLFRRHGSGDRACAAAIRRRGAVCRARARLRRFLAQPPAGSAQEAQSGRVRDV